MATIDSFESFRDLVGVNKTLASPSAATCRARTIRCRASVSVSSAVIPVSGGGGNLVRPRSSSRTGVLCPRCIA
eukprot:1619542-Amphidinium_carterae.1